MKSRSRIFIAATIAALSTVGQHRAANAQTKTNDAEQQRSAIAEIKPLGGSKVSGEVTFTEMHGGVLVRGLISGLEPGYHGFHVHEKGDCGDKGTQAGSHFDLSGNPHGNRDDQKRHVGDLGNIAAHAQGEAEFVFFDPTISLQGDRSIIGRALIVHEQEDDGESQPSGNSGDRIGCAIIEAQK